MARNLIQDTKGELVGGALRQGNPTKVVWKGTTTNDTATEIFLDGGTTANDRLIIPTDTVIIGQGFFTAWNETDSTFRAAGRFAISVSNIAGTVAALGTTVEWDAAATDANPFSQFFSGAGLAITYNNTFKAVVITVTGVASKNIRWVVELSNYLVQAL